MRVDNRSREVGTEKVGGERYEVGGGGGEVMESG